MPSAVPENVRALLRQQVDSFEKLEIVLALHRGGQSTVEELAGTVGAPRQTIREAAQALRSSSLIHISGAGHITLLPPTTPTRVAVIDLVQAYEADRFVILNEMTSIAMDRIRNMAAHVFANAFLLRRPKS